MKFNDFLLKRGVFTLKELDEYLVGKGSMNKNTRKNLLSYYQKNDRIVKVRRGLYLVVPPGSNSNQSSYDTYLIAAKMTENAVLGYHTALELHGKAYSVFFHYCYFSLSRSVPLQFRSNTFQAVAVPQALREKGKELFGVVTRNRSGVDVRVTNFERTFVDVLDRPELSGSWEEIWRSLESIEFFDLDQVLEYVELLGNATTSAKVGFFLEQHKDSLLVDSKYLSKLKELSPKQTQYMDESSKKDGQLLKDWNLIVPKEVLNRTWEEVL
ncbi:MAG: transcriptional regulator [Candidatus Omnitrophica bacterium]|nr:transcriptional regulator [Candidatus Omnitrophota bacterium]